MTAARPRLPRADRIGLAPRILLAELLVIVAGAGTLAVAALLPAPGGSRLVPLATAVVVAAVTALTVSWLVARRLAAPVHAVAGAARRLADGHYRTEVPDPRLGPEFASLAGSMNLLSRRLAATETDRRRLTSDVAHQLRTPVAALQATVEALIDGVIAADAETLTVLAEQARRLHVLVADLEKVSRAEERQLVLHPATQPVGPLVHRCVAAARDRYRTAGVDLVPDVDPHVPAGRGDADRIAEALGNLLDNALRHTPPGGTVTVSAGPLPAGAAVTVRDTGEGFVPAEAPLLFERFRRGAGAVPGTGSGLGLTLARAVAEAHGGELVARSDGPGRGAAFTLVLPAA